MIFLIMVRPGFVSPGCDAHLVARRWHAPRSGHAAARPKPAVIEPPATAETSGYSCRVERLFLGSRWPVGVPGGRGDVHSPALMTIQNDVRTVRYPVESRPATSGGVRGKARRKL